MSISVFVLTDGRKNNIIYSLNLIFFRSGTRLRLSPAASYIVLSPEYSRPTHRGARTTVFIVLGLSGVFPITHAVHTHGIRILIMEMGFLRLLLSGTLYIVGAVI